MLSSITPLGQRGRGQSWGRTVIAFWFGAVVAASVLFGGLGATGDLLGLSGIPAGVVVVTLGAAAALDFIGVTPFGPRRQVDEDWLGRYRDWVVGLGFGSQLGMGVATIVRSWSVWAILIVSAMVGWPDALAIGIAFGAGRSVLLLASGRATSTETLTRDMARFVGSERWAVGLLTLGYVAVIGSGLLGA